jgi:uncharacterized protein
MSAPVWVIDTNVLVSAALTAGGNCDQLLRAAMNGHLRLAWSTPMMAEYRAVLSRPKFKLSPAVVSSLLATFRPSEQVTPGTAPTLPDPDDEIFLATAIAASSKVIVTGNSAHFPPDVCTPISVLNPAEARKLQAKIQKFRNL